MDNNIDLSAVNNTTPEFTATPTIDDDSVVSVDGQYVLTNAKSSSIKNTTKK